jgi:hypothetical protein
MSEQSPSPTELTELEKAFDQEIQHWAEWFGVEFTPEAHSGLVWVLAKQARRRLDEAGRAGETKGFKEGYAARVAEEQLGYGPYEK